MFDEQPLTWTCHICKDERPDDKISVFKHERLVGKPPVTFTENVRYCNDRPECLSAAMDFHFIPENT